MRRFQPRKLIYVLLLNSLFILSSNHAAIAVMPSAYPIPNPQVGTPHPMPSPSPGPSPTPPIMGERINFISPSDFVKPLVGVLQVSIANRATGTPGLLEGPRLAVANIGGYGQIAPTVTTIVRNSFPTVALVLRGLLQFGASS